MSETPTQNTSRRLASFLMPGEQVLHGAHIHWLSYLRPLALLLLGLGFCAWGVYSQHTALLAPPDPATDMPGRAHDAATFKLAGWLVLGACLSVMALLGLLRRWLINWSTLMAITSRRVILRTGIIARDISDVPLAKVDLVLLDQSILGRIFDCGNVVVRTVGETSTVFAAIANPTAMRNAVLGAMETSTKPAPAEKTG